MKNGNSNKLALFLQKNESNTREPEMDDRFEKVPMFLVEHFGFTLQQNAWAGPDHWKYQNPKGR